jgi:hypothetical protein
MSKLLHPWPEDMARRGAESVEPSTASFLESRDVANGSALMMAGLPRWM